MKAPCDDRVLLDDGYYAIGNDEQGYTLFSPRNIRLKRFRYVFELRPR